MADHVVKLPDVGEGIAEAELVEWHVKVGDVVSADATLAAVMTDKATVEIHSPVDGEIAWLGGEIGHKIAVGSDLVRLKRSGEAESERPPPKAGPAPSAEPAHPEAEPARPAAREPTSAPRPAPRARAVKPTASPAVRRRAQEAGIDLRQVPGTGPAGRITHDDLDAFAARETGPSRPLSRQRSTAVEEVKVIGLRRRIAEKMAVAHSHIPHITYVEEIDVTALEELRNTLNSRKRNDQPRLTLLPFLMRAMVSAIARQPRLNAIFDDAAGIIHQHAGIHIGIATQTTNGLLVPVVRHTESLDLWDCAAAVARLAEATRDGSATREELSGSTITISSLGAIGGVVSTPIINHPEVAIVGVNKIVTRPVWDVPPSSRER